MWRGQNLGQGGIHGAGVGRPMGLVAHWHHKRNNWCKLCQASGNDWTWVLVGDGHKGMVGMDRRHGTGGRSALSNGNGRNMCSSSWRKRKVQSLTSLLRPGGKLERNESWNVAKWYTHLVC